MADTAAHLVDRVLPRVPVRQWVLSLPFGLRYRLAHDRELTATVLRVLVRAIFASLRRRSRAERSTAAHGGTVTFVQRFGGALNLNVHFHTLALDGVYRTPGEDRTLRFHPTPPPSAEELEGVLNRVVRGIARAIARRGLGDEPDRLFEDDPLLAQLLAGAVQGRVATGPRAGQKVLRFGDRIEFEAAGSGATEETPGLARRHGFSLHAGVAVPANDRQRLERIRVASSLEGRNHARRFRAAGVDRSSGRAGATPALPHGALSRSARIEVQAPCRGGTRWWRASAAIVVCRGGLRSRVLIAA